MRQVLVISLLFLISSCSSYEEVPSFDADVTLLPTGEYEVKTTFSSSYRGNMHAPWDLRKHVSLHEKYFAVPRIKGEVNFTEIKMFEKSEIFGVTFQKHVKGKIIFDGSIMTLNISLPRYEGSSSIPVSWEPYRFNGKYSMQMLANK
jgi:hypothetical protein